MGFSRWSAQDATVFQDCQISNGESVTAAWAAIVVPKAWESTQTLHNKNYAFHFQPLDEPTSVRNQSNTESKLKMSSSLSAPVLLAAGLRTDEAPLATPDGAELLRFWRRDADPAPAPCLPRKPASPVRIGERRGERAGDRSGDCAGERTVCRRDGGAAAAAAAATAPPAPVPLPTLLAPPKRELSAREPSAASSPNNQLPLCTEDASSAVLAGLVLNEEEDDDDARPARAAAATALDNGAGACLTADVAGGLERCFCSYGRFCRHEK